MNMTCFEIKALICTWIVSNIIRRKKTSLDLTRKYNANCLITQKENTEHFDERETISAFFVGIK